MTLVVKVVWQLDLPMMEYQFMLFVGRVLLDI